MEQKKERDYLFEEMYNSLILRESYGFSQVERIDVTILNSWDGKMNGLSVGYTPDSKACFNIRCPFSECYGPLTGFRFTDRVSETVRQKLTSSVFRVSCGGYGDHAHRHHCDNWIEVEVRIKYREDCQTRQ